MYHTRHLLSIVALTLLLSGCGGGDQFNAFEGDAGPSGTNGKSTLLALSAEPAGGHCATGGSKIDAGQDANANGVLDANEVSSTQYICGGANAGAATSTLVRMLDEPSGANCAAGGKTISVGIDSNANAALDAGEVTSTGYVCNGSNGANGTSGTNGTNGLNMLMSIVVEPVGTNCAYGGQKTSSGLDANADSVLDAGEVSATSFVCNGAPGATLSWEIVTDATVSTPAKGNTGYVANNATAQVVVILPSNPAFGDIVRVSGAGLGGWKIEQNDGQRVRTKNLGVGIAGYDWMAHLAGPANWQSVASSADGSKLVAAASGDSIYVSTDSGATWTPRATKLSWNSVASSADGGRLLAVEEGVDNSQIHMSIDGGATWAPNAGAGNQSWLLVASSADGSKLAAAVDGGEIFVSTDGGITWAAKPASGARGWDSLAMSADGGTLVASADGVFTSKDDGNTWTAHPIAFARAVASSADGATLIAAGDDGGHVWTSANGGDTWTERFSDAPRNWFSAASSADGSVLVVVDGGPYPAGGRIYTSTDGGLTWTPRETDRFWKSVAISANGSKVVALSDAIYTSTPSTTLGSAGSISGAQLDAITLQYLGDGLFNVLSHEGSLTVR